MHQHRVRDVTSKEQNSKHRGLCISNYQYALYLELEHTNTIVFETIAIVKFSFVG